MDYQLIEAQYELLFEFAVSPQFKKAYDYAEDIFTTERPSDDLLGFAEWFMFNYEIIDQDKTIAEIFAVQEPSDIRAAISQSQRSIFKIYRENEKVYLKDIFTNESLLLGHELFAESGLLNARIVILDHDAYIIGDLFEMDASFEEAIKKAVFEAYNKFCIDHDLIKIDEFINKENRMLYNIASIIHETIEENTIDDDYTVHEGLFAYKCSYDALVEFLLKLPYTLQADDDDEFVYSLILDEDVVGEIEIVKQTFTILCLTEHMLHKIIENINLLKDENIIFMKSHMLTLDELL
ncbi:hypothetical protein [Fusibacter sp. 3D3]|uniref:hypothetical protein n=1 Tax=Fusibacter sp. 3D3 TaxID=1048380 RepID=UPI00085294AE|nr:hypothetical protein [Fusibacter sp. 3D3]GAU77450.1 hypothetical protein F3D3_2079 [Fusibacter sp. 3D3]